MLAFTWVINYYVLLTLLFGIVTEATDTLNGLRKEETNIGKNYSSLWRATLDLFMAPFGYVVLCLVMMVLRGA